MYTVNFNGYPIHDPRLADVGIFSSDASASLMVNGAGSVYLTLLPTHPNLDKIGGAGKLEVLSDDQILFRGRVRRKDEDFLGQATFTAEGDLAALNDSVQPAYNFPGDFADDPEYKGSKNVVAYLFGKMLERHNAQVEPSQMILPGTVTVSDPNNYLVRSMENPNYTWEAMCNAFWGSSLGGYAVVRYTAGGTYLDYLAEINVKNQQRVEFGKNMLDLTQYGDTTEACSAVYPIGAEGLTIESIPDGDYRGFKKSGNVLISQDAVEIYGGRITKIQTWEDVTLAENLVDKAADWLESQGSLSLTSITCQAIDLQTVDGEPAPLMVGRLTAVVSPPHGIDENFVLTEVALSISDPTATSVTFGKVKKTLSSEIVSSENQNAEVIEEIRTDIKGNLAYTKDEIKRVSMAIQDSEKIVLGVIEERVTAVSGEVQDLEDAVNAGLGELQSQIDGQIMTWFYNYVPTTENEPAVSWATMVEKDKHLGDVFYIVDNPTQGGQAYRWAKVDNVYKWVLIEDVEVAKALADAAKAQDTADGKRRVFVATPKPPYDVGDLWAQGASGDLMRCNKARQTGSYVASDWGKATDYTNDDNLDKFINGAYQTTVDKVSELVTTSESITARVEETETTITTVQASAVTDTITQYYLSTSKTELSSGTWSETAPEWVDGKYMWSRTKTTKGDGSVSYSAPTCIAGATGATGPQGEKGEPGAAGVGVKSIDVQYYLSTSSTTLTGGSWSTTAPTWVNGKYMWSKTVTTLSSGGVEESKPVCITGAKGSTGASGTTITAIEEEYYLSDSKTEQTGGSWVPEPPVWSAGKYLWTRSKIVYANPTKTEYTTPVCDSSWEAVNEVQVGGTNLLLDTDVPSLTKVAAAYDRRFTASVNGVDALGTIESLSDSPGGTKNAVRINMVTTDGFGAGIVFYNTTRENVLGISFVPGEQYTVSCYARATSGEPKINMTIWGLTAWGWQDVPGAWTKFSLTFTATEAFNTTTSAWAVFRLGESIGAAELTGFKIEKGNKATDWTPAPEDTQVQIDGVVSDVAGQEVILNSQESRISNLELNNDSIEASVSKLETTTLTTLDGIKTTVSKLEEKAGLAITEEDVTIAIESKLENADGIFITGTDYGFSADGLRIAKDGQAMESLLDNSGLEVSRSGEEILTADDTGVNALNLTARQYLIVGNHARFENYGTGRTACFWIGG